MTKNHFTKTVSDIYKIENPDFYESLFNAFDSSHNRKLCFVEFLMAVSLGSNKDIDKKLELVFKIYDLNKNGKLTKKEVTRVLKSILKLNEKRMPISDLEIQRIIDHMFEVIDTDKNNYLTVDEFIEGCKKDKNILETFNYFS